MQEARVQFINDRVNERLQGALAASAADDSTMLHLDDIAEELEESVGSRQGIVTTEEEIDGFNIVRAISRELVAVDRVAMRDTKSYCGVLLDDNNRKPVCRLHFNGNQKYVGLFTQKAEERVAISSVDDIFAYADQIKATLREYERVLSTDST